MGSALLSKMSTAPGLLPASDKPAFKILQIPILITLKLIRRSFLPVHDIAALPGVCQRAHSGRDPEGSQERDQGRRVVGGRVEVDVRVQGLPVQGKLGHGRYNLGKSMNNGIFVLL